MSVELTQYTPSIPVALGCGQTWTVELTNNSATQVPPSRLHLEADTYNSASSCLVPAIPPWATVSVRLTAQINAYKNIEHLTGLLTWTWNGRTWKRQEDMRGYVGKLKSFVPPTGTVPIYKLLLFGMAGATKSSFINCVLTLLSSERKVIETAGVGGCGRHNTRSLATYPIEGHHFALVDTWGLTPATYLNDDLENVVSGVYPRNWGMDMIFDHHAKAIRDNSHTRPERAVHAVIFMITHSALDKNDERELIKTNYALLQTLPARNPLVIITKVDEIVPAFRTNPMGDYPEVRELKQKVKDLLDIPENRVYAVVNYQEEREKCFPIDRNTYRIVEHALRTASENLRRNSAPESTVLAW